MSKILTVCHQGLCRSVGLADVLKLHFEPVDVIPVGRCNTANSPETREMLYEWADHIVIMEEKYRKNITDKYHQKILVCDVGPDRFGNSHNPQLIDMVWRWARLHSNILGITEHTERR